MQQDAALVILKTFVIAVFATFLALNFLSREQASEKLDKFRDKVDGLSTTVAESNRRVDKAIEESQAAKAATDRTYERLNALLDVIERGGVVARGPHENQPKTDQPKTPVEEKTGTPTIIAGKKVYPRNKGWTVVCDKNANDDPKRAIPEDKVDWDASMPIQLTGEPKGLNWYNDDRTVTVVALARYCVEMLAERKTTNPQQWNSHLAERIEQSVDKTEFLVYLRRGVRWHRPALDLDRYPWLKEPVEVTSRDVKYTVDMIRHPDTTSSQKPYWDELVSCDVIDKYTVRFKWKRANFLALQTTVELRALPAHIWAHGPDGKAYDAENVAAAFNSHWFSKNMCGNGPYRFAEYKRGDLLRFERNEDYFGPRATCKEIVCTIVPDTELRLARFWDNKAILVALGAEQYRRIILAGEAEEKGKIFKYAKFDKRPPKAWERTYFIWRRPVYGGFAWNMRRDIMADASVRRALTHALNRQAVVDKLFYGLGELLPVGQSVFSPYFPKDIEPLSFDLDKARSLLTAGGWRDTDGDGIREKVIKGETKKLEFELLISASSPLQRSIAAMFKADLLKCGARMNELPVSSTLWSQRNAKFDYDGFIVFWFADYESDPRQLWASEYAGQPGSNNYSGYENAEADKIFDELTTTFDYPTRIKLYRKWYGMQHRDQPYTWIWSVHSAVLLNTDWRVPEPKLPPPYIDRRLIFKWKK